MHPQTILVAAPGVRPSDTFLHVRVTTRRFLAVVVCRVVVVNLSSSLLLLLSLSLILVVLRVIRGGVLVGTSCNSGKGIGGGDKDSTWQQDFSVASRQKCQLPTVTQQY